MATKPKTKTKKVQGTAGKKGCPRNKQDYPSKALRPIHTSSPQKRAKFLQAILAGEVWDDAIRKVGIDPIEAAAVIDDCLTHRRDGVAVYVLAEKHLISSMKVLDQLSQKAADERIQLLAATKLADQSFRILLARPHIEETQKQTTIETAKQQVKNTWDVEFEDVHKG
jgi:hypothetical protein